MDPHSTSSDEPIEQTGEQPTESTNNDTEAPADEPAPFVPEIVPADTPLQGETPGADFSTVGTGSVFAISCTLLTVLIIFVCIAFFILFRVF